ncbi:3-hydroxyisobutyrate dehydrogenase-like beta-hydroxyacid dehydrogenase [Lipingzhangella halophila]|uniref:3-hydroxyisobutyrate dehydrogenase-like beta-hydroxyacid dehydrogenase n=1 Tax=Lipingzhangella halophila TaxID=1783352 RepID=A0A7W7RN01_9ACTN|nr:NAD(P)-binding domain-containing protein [Lipingzhangella halophila]MBB4935000.1 3-hydroxyisobutyrate dehydrogenase-like beta-hydroxyacid dehydrogenase [Lipingzhangella halophila]
MGANSESPVTVLGLGPMGSALAAAFTGNGHPTTVWNRTARKADPLVAKGAVRADTPAEAVVASPLVIVCVIDYDAAHAILDPLTAELRGRTLVNLTADSPDRAREMAEWAAQHGIDYLDGSIMTPTVTIGRPEAVFLYSGPEETYERHRPTLASLGGTATRVGAEPGRAAAFDVALLDTFWTAMSGIAHAFALARAESIPATELAPFAQGIVDLAGQIATELAADADAGRYSGEDSTLASNAAGMEHIIHAAHARGIDAGVLEAAKGTADRAIAAGHGEDGFARMVDAFSVANA